MQSRCIEDEEAQGNVLYYVGSNYLSQIECLYMEQFGCGSGPKDCKVRYQYKNQRRVSRYE